MTFLNKDTFICLDIEATGLDPKEDRIIEVAVAKFNFDGITEQFETLINPETAIPEESTKIHHIEDHMVQGKPKIEEVLPSILKIIDNHIIIGHGINYDITILSSSAKRCQVPCNIESLNRFDTLRLARLYGESPTNSLEALRSHFNIPAEGAHRAMNDVIVNIEVFKQLTRSFKKTKEVHERLKKPILLKNMPLGKHKGRVFRDIPVEYLRWASHQAFDQDLMFSIKNELKRRKSGHLFNQASNPFSNL
ncbi:MAG: DUF3820 family protein [Simkaniaceae bacterium]